MGPQDGELFDARRQRNGTDDIRAGPLGRLHDLRRRLIEQPVVVALRRILIRCLAIADSAYSVIEVIAPAPTVRPPSRMAKRWPTSRAMG